MRVLIATVTAGGGHVAAASALEEAWRTLRPDDVVEQTDLLKFFSRLQRRVYSEGYVKLVERAPELWGLVFKKTDSPKQARRWNSLQRILPSQTRTRFNRYLNQYKPDVVICTHYAPLELLAALSAKSGDNNAAKTTRRRPFAVSVVTDFEAHALWMSDRVDLYCVAAEPTKARLVARGATPENVVATGIPISTRFSTTVNVAALRKQYGLRDDLPVILVLSGGFGMGPVAELLMELDSVSRPLQTVVVAGRNEELRRKLAVQERKHPTHVIGFTTSVHELMAVADLIITKPGGLTSSEALAMGRPLLILNPIPGQEAANSDFLLENGAAAKANRVEDVPFRVTQLLGSKKLAGMAQAATFLGRPRAAEAVCREVLKRL